MPKKQDFQKWFRHVLKQISKYNNSELTVIIVDKIESRIINLRYRNQNKPTNIISFPCEQIFFKNTLFLGDLIICSNIIEQEALIFKKKLFARWAHIFIHGCLHLLGYTHENKIKRKIMEKIETTIVLSLGYKNPYIFDN